MAIFVLSVLINGQALVPGFDKNNPVNLQVESNASVLASVAGESFQSTFQNDPIVGRYISVAAITLSGFLVYGLLVSLFGSTLWVISCMGALLFLSHPAQTDALINVNYIDVAVGTCIGMLAWLVLQFGATQSRQWIWITLGSLIFTIGLVIRPSLVSLALIIPLAFWVFNRGTSRYRLIAMVLLTVVSAAYVLIAINQHLPYDWRPEFYGVYDWTIEQRISTIGHYMKISFWPTPLSSFYGYDAIPFSGFSSSSGFFTLLIIALWSVIGLLWLYNRKPSGLGLVIFLVAIFPFANILYPIEGLVIDRALMVPSIGVCIFMVSIFIRIEQRIHSLVSKSLFLVVILGFSHLSFARISLWKDYETLINTDVSNYPTSAKLLQLNGQYYFDQVNNFEGSQRTQIAKKAIRHLIPCSKLKPEWEIVHVHLGLLHDRELNLPYEAIPHFERSLRLEPKNFVSSFNLAGCYAQIGMNDSALFYIKKTLDVNPEHHESLEYLTSHYFKTGNVQLGFGFVNRFILLYPKSDVPHLILAEHFKVNKEEKLSVQQLEIAAQKNPTNKETIKFLFEYFYANNNIERAEYYRDLAYNN